MWQFPLCLTLGKSGILGVSRETQWQITPVTFPVTQIHTRWQTPQMKPFLLSTQPYNRRLGGDSVSGRVQVCICVCSCRLIPLSGGKCWLLMSFFPSFHKTQSHRLNWASASHSPASLTVPFSLSLYLSLSLCLWPWKIGLRKKKKREGIEDFQWSPLALICLYSWILLFVYAQIFKEA